NGNLLLSQLLGAKIHFNGENRKGEDIEDLKIRLEAEGKKVYVVPYGGSNLLGAYGFVDAVKELKNQLTEMNLKLAIKELAENEGILLDPVYSGRAFYGMLDYIKSQKIKKGANILFWHTGGLPANFYYSEELM
ncbi:hypothetical protein ACFFU1_17335, partial [Algibacter miyuki]